MAGYLEPSGYYAPKSEATPLMLKRDRGGDPESAVFTPGRRIKMNVVPMFLNVFVPWGAFVLCCGVSSFWVMYARPTLAWILVGLVLAFWACLVGVAWWARRRDRDPTWFSYTAAAVGVMAVWGTLSGLHNFATLSRPYFEIKDLKAIQNVDAGAIPGASVLDSGIVQFRTGSRVDTSKAWHFRWKTTYCVAPVVSYNGTSPPAQVYDYWAVGKDCCPVAEPGFKCGDITSRRLGGIRIVNKADVSFYRMAVEQAESFHNISASDPIFLEVSARPSLQVESWNQQVFKSYMFSVVAAFVVNLFLTTMASCGFAFIGRAKSAYSNEVL